MLYAMKNNKQVKIDETEKKKFINLGYKIAKVEKDKLVFEDTEAEESKEVKELKAENKALKAEVKALKEEGEKRTKGEGK